MDLPSVSNKRWSSGESGISSSLFLLLYLTIKSEASRAPTSAGPYTGRRER